MRRIKEFVQHTTDDIKSVTPVLSSSPTIGWAYKCGSFKLKCSFIIKEEQQINSGANVTANLRIGGQVFTCPSVLQPTGGRVIQEVSGQLYDSCFPDKIEVTIKSRAGVLKSKELPDIKFQLDVADKFEQSQYKLGDTRKFPIVYEDSCISFNFDALVDINYNNPVAKDKNVTPMFKEMMAVAESDLNSSTNTVKKRFHKQHPSAERCHVVLVPGFFTNHYPLYFRENVKTLERLDIPYSIMPIDTEGTVEDNARAITNYIRNVNKEVGVKVILVCHSKGGVDALEAILNDKADMSAIIHAVISMQCPYNGTSIVEWADSAGIFKNLNNVVKNVWSSASDKLNDTQESINGLSHIGRMERMKELHSMQIARNQGSDFFSFEELLHPIKFVTMSSHADFHTPMSTNLADTISKGSMAMVDGKMAALGHRSDGLVTMQDGRLPGSSAIFLENMFHTNPGLHVTGNPYHTGALTQALLEVTFTLYPMEDCAPYYSESVTPSKSMLNKDFMSAKQWLKNKREKRGDSSTKNKKSDT